MNPMLRYVVRRFLFIIATYMFAISIIFLIPRIIPANPLELKVQEILEKMVISPEGVRAVEQYLIKEFGFDKPIYEQYLDFLSKTLRGDLGVSVVFWPQKISDIIFRYLPWTLGLLIPATIVSWTLGNLLGAYAGYKRKTPVDNVLLTVFIVISQIPYYFLGMLFLYVFAVKLSIFPLGGAYSAYLAPSLSPEFIASLLHHYALPFLSIVISATGGWALGMRVLVIYELRSDYMIYADSLGLSDSKLLRYAFKNSSLPMITALAISLGSVLGGSLLTELVFNYPGLGYILYVGATRLDWVMIQSSAVLIVGVFLTSLFIVDLIYAYVDPRVRLGYEGG